MAKNNPGLESNEQFISIQSPFGGWVSPVSGTISTPHFSASVEGTEAPTFAKQNTNQYAESDGISLFQAEKFAHLGPGRSFSPMPDTSSFVNDLALNGGVSSTAGSSGAIAVLKNGRVVAFDPSGSGTSAKYDPSSHVPISSLNGDMVIFRDYQSTPVEWVVWSWDYSGGSEVSIAHASNFGSPTDGWYSGLSFPLLTPNVPHKIWKGPDGNIYILNGSTVQQVVVNGALGSATAGNTLNLGPGWIATGGCSFKNYSAIIYSNKLANASRGETRVCFWDGLTTTVNGVTSTAPEFIFDIPDNFGNGIFFDGNTLFALTNGRNNSSKIFEYSSKGFIKSFETPFINPTAAPIQGSIESFQDSLIIGATKGNANGHLFRFYGEGFHDEGYLCDSDTTAGHIASSVGMVRNLSTTLIFVGVKYSSTFKIFVTGNNYQSQGSTNVAPIGLRTVLFGSGILGRRQYPLGFQMTVSRIKIFLSQWGTGAGLLLSLFEGYNAFDVGGAADRLNLQLDTDNTAAENINHHAFPIGTYEIDISDLAITNLSSFYMSIQWTHPATTSIAAIIRRIEIHVSPSQ